MDARQTEIGILLYPGAQLASVHGLTDLLNVADRIAQGRGTESLPRIRITHWRIDEHGGAPECVFDTGPGSAAAPEVIVVPLILVERRSAKVTDAVAAWLSAKHAVGATLASFCSGAFLLAATGILNGRVVSTHWGCAEELAERFPAIHVDAERRIADYGDVITAGGFMAWIDLGLRIVDRFLGPAIALETARFLTVDSDLQMQPYLHGFSPRLSHGDEAVLRVQHWLHRRDARGASLNAMATQAQLEKRTFLRRFTRATGMRPAEYCRRLRISRARELLEFSNRPVKEIAWSVGYTDSTAFARVFQKLTALSPAAYRRQFGAGHRSAAMPNARDVIRVADGNAPA